MHRNTASPLSAPPWSGLPFRKLQITVRRTAVMHGCAVKLRWIGGCADQAVLGGRQDRVALCGIDRWFGGVHLLGDAGLWRWDDARQRITFAG